MLAAIRIRGSVKTDKKVADTLSMLKLTRNNHCVLLPENQTFRGMLKKTSTWITWGKIDNELVGRLISKRGRLVGDKKIDEKKAKDIAKKIIKDQSLEGIEIKHVFRLSPPSKGYKSVKMMYPKGSLGPRGEKINELLKRMI
jgi:large subunit ribosomal protein L30